MVFVLLEFLRQRWAALALFFLTLITAGSLWPLAELPAVPGSDKLHHLIAYAALSLPIAIRRHKFWLLLLLGCLLWSGAIELIQPYVNRYGEWADLAANFVGLVLGTLLGATMRKRIRSAPSI